MLHLIVIAMAIAGAIAFAFGERAAQVFVGAALGLGVLGIIGAVALFIWQH
jgi:hypothetical protein